MLESLNSRSVLANATMPLGCTCSIFLIMASKRGNPSYVCSTHITEIPLLPHASRVFKSLENKIRCPRPSSECSHASIFLGIASNDLGAAKSKSSLSLSGISSMLNVETQPLKRGREISAGILEDSGALALTSSSARASASSSACCRRAASFSSASTLVLTSISLGVPEMLASIPAWLLTRRGEPWVNITRKGAYKDKSRHMNTTRYLNIERGARLIVFLTTSPARLGRAFSDDGRLLCSLIIYMRKV
mmetsp:Transcript_17686/g.21110  ORF Transcript_17686/g.21110 Transcript_17686/m.21110 type:complete len:248 (+) Transcript_17686:1922-2665(+)